MIWNVFDGIHSMFVFCVALCFAIVQTILNLVLFVVAGKNKFLKLSYTGRLRDHLHFLFDLRNKDEYTIRQLRWDNIILNAKLAKAQKALSVTQRQSNYFEDATKDAKMKMEFAEKANQN